MARYQVTHPGFYFLSVFSLSILLVLIGLFVTGLFFSQQYARTFKENIKLIAEIAPETPKDITGKMTAFLRKAEGVRAESVTFISSDEIFNEMSDEIGHGEIADQLENPFLDIIEFSVYEEYLNDAFVEELRAQLSASFPLAELHRPQSFYGDIFALIAHLRVYILVFILIALGLTGMLIHHIMRLNVVAQQEQIRTMELVGAQPGFIVRPFVMKGLQMGLYAWVIALGLSGLMWFLLLGRAGFMALVQSPSSVTGALVLLLVSLLTCASSTWIAVMKSVGRTYM